MLRIYHDCSDPVYLYCDRLMAGLVYAFATYTVCYHLAILLKLSLKSLTVMSLFAVTAIFLFYLLAQRRTFSTKFESDDRNLWVAVMLAAMAVVCGLLSLLSSRPDADDVDYLVRAVYNYENFSQPLFLHSPFAFVANEKTDLWSFLRSYEHSCASLALISGVKPIHIYHYVVPFFAGASVPIVWYLVLSRLTGSPCAAVFGAMAVVLVLCTDGPSHQSVGNWAFVRIWAGKCLLMTILTPLCIKYLLEAFNASSISAYVRVAACSVVGLGFSSISFFYLPLLFGTVALSYYIVEFRATPLRKIALTGAVLSAYLLVFGPANYWKTQGMIAGYSFESLWPNDLLGIARIVFGSPPGVSGTIAIVSLGILAGLKKWRVLVWLLIWAAIILIPLSFQWICSWISTYLTSRNAFWRILYILPTLLCIGIAAAELYKRFSAQRWATAFVAAALIMTVVLLNSSLGGIAPWAKTGVSFPVLRLKLPEGGLAYSLDIIHTLQPGSMIAPEEISQSLPILTARFPQCYLRSYEKLTEFGDRQTMLRRLATHNFIGKQTTSDEAFGAFVEEIGYPYKYVILPSEVSGQERNAKALTEAGFVSGNVIGNKFRVFERK